MRSCRTVSGTGSVLVSYMRLQKLIKSYQHGIRVRNIDMRRVHPVKFPRTLHVYHATLHVLAMLRSGFVDSGVTVLFGLRFLIGLFVSSSMNSAPASHHQVTSTQTSPGNDNASFDIGFDTELLRTQHTFSIRYTKLTT